MFKKKTAPQTSLSRTKRLRNRKNAFIVDSKEIKQKRVLLIDDVMSTGATAHGATRAILSAGAKTVTFFCIAKNVEG